MSSVAWAPVNRAVSGRGPEQSETIARSVLTDEDLLRRCADGDGSSLEELTRRHQAAIYRFLLRMLGSPEDAEEAALDVFVRAWQHAGRFQYRAKVATWLYRIAVNIARDVHSRKRSRPQEPWPENGDLLSMSVGSAETDALTNLERNLSSQKLKVALQSLSDGDRLILVLYYLEDRDYDEIQAITGLSYTVLKTRLARARKRLRSIIGEEN
ncbi:MAG: sigma-70 family RNA polymerase sigma factor [Chthonomonadales bacterium]